MNQTSYPIPKLIVLLMLLSGIIWAQSQDKPYWVKNLLPQNTGNIYFGIGTSAESQEQADDNARVEFTKMIEVDVKNKTEYQLKESSGNLNDEFKIQSQVVTNMKLKGVAISERFFDSAESKYYSLIKYDKDQYIKLMEDEIKREIAHAEQKNLAREKQTAEQQRHENEMAKLEQAEKKAELTHQKEKDRLALESKRQKEQHSAVIKRTRTNFIKMQKPFKMIDIENATILSRNHVVSLKPTVSPLAFSQAEYSFFYKMIGFSAAAYWVDEKLQLQDARLRLQVLKTTGNAIDYSIALGVAQYTSNIADDAETGFSPTLAADIALAEYYVQASFYAERRKAAFGLIYFPFFDQLEGKLSMVLQNEVIFDDKFRNRFGEKVLIQPGIRFSVVPDSFSLMVSYEDNEYIALTFDLMF